MNRQKRQHSIDSLFTLLLLLCFALFTLALAAMGSLLYQNGVKQLNKNYTSRTAIAYVSEKIRQHDTAGSVFLTEIEESLPALALLDTSGEDSYITYLYFTDGELRELFIRADAVPSAAMGTCIVELEDFSLETSASVLSSDTGGASSASSEGDSRLWRITATDADGTSLSAWVSPNSSWQESLYASGSVTSSVS